MTICGEMPVTASRIFLGVAWFMAGSFQDGEDLFEERLAQAPQFLGQCLLVLKQTLDFRVAGANAVCEGVAQASQAFGIRQVLLRQLARCFAIVEAGYVAALLANSMRDKAFKQVDGRPQIVFACQAAIGQSQFPVGAVAVAYPFNVSGQAAR